MTLTIDLSPQEEGRLLAAAQQEGVDIATFAKRLLTAQLPETAQKISPADDPKNAASLALLNSWLAEAPTDSEAIREAEEDLNEFKRNLNLPRKASGARLLFPEVE